MSLHLYLLLMVYRKAWQPITLREQADYAPSSVLMQFVHVQGHFEFLWSLQAPAAQVLGQDHLPLLLALLQKVVYHFCHELDVSQWQH